ncbi:MAG: glycosyltransferase, partial [Pedobacter sp.]
MREFVSTFETIFNNAIFYYALFVMGSYVVLTLLSAIEMNGYMKKNSYVNYREILVSPLAPSVSILAPAYNEEASIIENIRSLLSLHYGNYEVIIINILILIDIITSFIKLGFFFKISLTLS